MNSPSSKSLPVFLRVLLVLSFIGSGFGLFKGLQDALSKPTKERVETFMQIIEQVEDTPETTSFKEDWISYIENENLNIKNFGVARFLFSAISLIGIFLMYRLQRKGFWIYSIAQIFMLSFPIAFGGYSSFSVSITILMGFLTFLFIGMYASQLRHMTP
jgi:hypothetical protein